MSIPNSLTSPLPHSTALVTYIQWNITQPLKRMRWRHLQQHGWSQRLLYWVKSDGEREISHDIIYMQNLYKPVMQMDLITKQKQTHRLKRRNSWELLSFYSFASSFLQQTKQHFTFFFFYWNFLRLWLYMTPHTLSTSCDTNAQHPVSSPFNLWPWTQCILSEYWFSCPYNGIE